MSKAGPGLSFWSRNADHFTGLENRMPSAPFVSLAGALYLLALDIAESVL